MKTAYSSLIDFTDFGTVRRYLRSARSPITHVVFVARQELLAKLAAALDPSDQKEAEAGQRQIRRWSQEGEIALGRFSDDDQELVDLSRIDEETRCAVIFVPPYYLVWLKEAGWSEITHQTCVRQR